MNRTAQEIAFGAVGIFLLCLFILGMTVIGVVCGLNTLLISGAGLFFGVIIASTVMIKKRNRSRHEMLQRYVNGCCLHCGYALLATQRRCPECGKEQTVDDRRSNLMSRMK